MFCTKCGMKLRAEDKFCVRCGNAISREVRPYEPAHSEQAAAVQDVQESAGSVLMQSEKIRTITPENQILENSGKEQNTKNENHMEQEALHAQMKNPEVHTNPGQKSKTGSSAHNQGAGQELPELAYAGLFSEKKSSSHADDFRSRHKLAAQDDKIQAENENGRIESIQKAKTGTEAMPHSPLQEPHLYAGRTDFTGTAAVHAVQQQPVAHAVQQPVAQAGLKPHPVSHLPLGNPQETELLSVFAGPNSEYYLSSWKKPYSMNWAALLLTIFWMGYRKLFAPMVITAGSFILIGLGIAASGIYWLAAIAVPLCMGVTGFLANRIYLSHAREEMNRVLGFQGAWEEKRKLLVSKGGTSSGGAMIAAGVVIGYSLISILIFSIL